VQVTPWTPCLSRPGGNSSAVVADHQPKRLRPAASLSHELGLECNASSVRTLAPFPVLLRFLQPPAVWTHLQQKLHRVGPSQVQAYDRDSPSERWAKSRNSGQPCESGHYMIQPLVERYGDCMVVLKVS
jgi:hypothetical protein